MVIDMHVHPVLFGQICTEPGQLEFRKKAFGVYKSSAVPMEQVIAVMDHACVDQAVLLGCEMSIQEMKDYLDLCLEGEGTIPQRKEMLAKKQEALRNSIQELEDSVAYIDWKQNFYDEVLSGKRPYISNLIRIQE